MTIVRLIILSILLIVVTLPVQAQTDCDNCKDHLLIPRMPQYYIETFEEQEFGKEYFFDGKKFYPEGKRYSYKYRHTHWKDKNYKKPSAHQIFENYENEIIRLGGKVIFEQGSTSYYQFETEAQQKIWLKLEYVFTPADYFKMIIIEEVNMVQDVVIKADAIKDRIDIYGKVAIEGIYFDTGKSTIRAESTPAISEIANYLKSNPSVNCWVVGHTDSDGAFELNSKLSLDRASAIKSELESQYGIKVGRLYAEGVGPLAPIASNKTDEGRQKNRRVELVLK